METNPEWLSVIVEVIGNLGFPIFVAWFLLQRMENKLDELVKAIQDLNHVFNNTNR
ncbi:YvrJ protein family protein [Carnobacterium iners]|uniref:YvrJ protein family protein n=1 Tax=Carnobacterium iners TaxID=1073423 RepID=A0A1X7N4N1_9LACT|nr:YvrJ family protein [Carnobacterium iners]SEL19530.1 YvrJ protein family protein [Carnobacterium iners]SMH31436.1 YvrJ protein family protein [Carnobacterium iners]